MSDDTVDSVLRQIRSTNLQNDISNSYQEVAESMKETGTPSNNMLLSIIHAEIKRSADESVKTSTFVLDMKNEITKLNDTMHEVSDLLSKQNAILASMSISNSGNTSTVQSKKPGGNGKDWYYQGVKLTSRYHVCACIISHLINMVQMHVDKMGKDYPDSVDCDFTRLQTAVRIVSTRRCKSQYVDYRESIDIQARDSQSFDLLLPVISSTNHSMPTTLSESQIGSLYNPITRPIMQCVDWIKQRLCLLPGILSPRQMDILRSIKYPQVSPEAPNELNWNPNSLTFSNSHILSKDIVSLSKKSQEKYIGERMNGKSIENALQAVENQEDSPKIMG